MLLPLALAAQDKPVKVSWDIPAKLPVVPGLEKQPGLAGVFAGVSNDVLIIAGGAYFPDKMPWEGGKKAHTDRIFVLRKDAGGKLGWVTSFNTHLKSKTAYGAGTTTPDGVVCVGGETETTNSSRTCFLMKWDAAHNKVDFTDLPGLPIPVANACIASIGEKVYLAGGENNGVPSAKVFLLDMGARYLSWQSLADLPIAMSHSVAVAQSNGKCLCIYVIGGRSATPKGVSVLHHTAFVYDPIQKKWGSLNNISNGSQITNLSATTAVAVGAHNIMVVGGDKGDVFHQIETYNYEIANAVNDTVKQRLQAGKLNLITNHIGFSRNVLLYNTLTNTWKKIGELPYPAHVTTVAVKWGNQVFIPGGEIKPGIRTPDILRAEIINEYK